MYRNNDTLHEYMKNHGCNFEKEIEVTFVDGSTMNLDNSDIFGSGFTIQDSISSDGSFDVGSTIINKLSVSLNNLYGKFDEVDFYGAEFKPTVRLKDENGVLLYQARKGTFVVDNAVLNDCIVTVTAYDDMRKFDKPFNGDDFAFPITVGGLIGSCCIACGVLTTFDATKFRYSNIVINKIPDGDSTTFREVVSWCCQILGAYARIRMNGTPVLEIKRLTDTKPDLPIVSDTEIDLNRYFSLTSDVDDAVITGIKVLVKSNAEGNPIVTYNTNNYSEGYVISIEGNELIDEANAYAVCESIEDALLGLRFRVCEITSISDPTIEAGDWIIVEDRKGNKMPVPVTSTTFSSGSPQRITCSGQKTQRNSSTRYTNATKNYIETLKLVQSEKTQRELMQKDLEDKINSSGGMFTTTERDENGNIIAYYLHNAENLDESLTIWKMTSDAMAVSTDGGKTWNGGITVDGNIIANILNANGVDASWIRSGEINIKDDKGNQTFYANTATGEVKINAKSIEIGGQTIQQLAQDAASQTGGLAVTLSSEFQLVPARVDGTVDFTSPSFTPITTEVKVYYNGADVTHDGATSIVPTASNGIGFIASPISDNSIVTLTRFDASLDDGYIDFAIDYNTMKTTKRFKVTKIKDAKGSYNYTVECNKGIMKIANDGSIDVDELEFYVSVNNEEEQFVEAVRFVIEESSDNGSTFTEVYRTPDNELMFSVRHILKTLLADKNGDVITDKDGSAIGFFRKITDVRCKALNENGIVVAQKTITSYTDAKEYTHDEIFNLLTNDGKLVGIYKYNNQMYINASYIKSGVLKLGGNNNSDGSMEIYNSSGKLIGKWDKDGIAIKQGTFETTNGNYRLEISDSATLNGYKKGELLSRISFDASHDYVYTEDGNEYHEKFDGMKIQSPEIKLKSSILDFDTDEIAVKDPSKKWGYSYGRTTTFRAVVGFQWWTYKFVPTNFEYLGNGSYRWVPMHIYAPIQSIAGNFTFVNGLLCGVDTREDFPISPTISSDDPFWPADDDFDDDFIE